MSEERPSYTTGNKPTDLENVITQVITFSDGSRLTVTIAAPPAVIGHRLLNKDLATRHYYAHLFERLNLIERLSKPGNSADD